ncbi:MAG: sterol carrier family protein [Actinomycetota bacterium]|nr:sterol carrier family protein [Actinomycetota bacterium]
MPARLKQASAEQVAAAWDALRADERDPDALRLLTKHYLAVLVSRHPGRSVEVRVPPYAAVQCVGGTRHTRGTPPAVVETDALTWVRLARGATTWAEAVADGRLVASGERSDLAALLPLE